nr:glutamyl-tRNA reductase 2, chloroplastic-like [Tanacetum cinerariifolium]
MAWKVIVSSLEVVKKNKHQIMESGHLLNEVNENRIIQVCLHQLPNELKLSRIVSGPQLCALNHIEEADVLSTCNGIEIYLVSLSQHREVKVATKWISKS